MVGCTLIRCPAGLKVDPLEFIGKFLMSKAANKFQKTIGDLSEEKVSSTEVVFCWLHVVHRE